MAHFNQAHHTETLEERIIDISRTEIPELLRLMNSHIVEFSFSKANGDVRVAHGTLSLKYIPLNRLCERFGEDASSLVNTLYYDIDKQAWRAFSNRNFIAIRKTII